MKAFTSFQAMYFFELRIWCTMQSCTSVLGKTLPSLLYDACARYQNPRAFNQPEGEDWRAVSLDAFRQASEETALGLLELGLERGDRVALFMESDVHFCVADMGCLVAGLVDVPIYLTHAAEQVHFVVAHSGSKVLFTSSSASSKSKISRFSSRCCS